jgi:hypothetical protein
MKCPALTCLVAALASGCGAAPGAPGVEDAAPLPPGPGWADAFIDMVSTRVVIGAEEDVVSHWYTGSMDELRLEKGMRGAEWIGAQYRAMTVANFVRVEGP